MKYNYVNASLKCTALFFLVLSVISLALVSERAVSAVWQLYMFYGYETAGIITLSIRTGIMFFVVSMFVIVGSHMVKQICNRRELLLSARLAKVAFFVSLISFVIYALVAFSPLNKWMP